MLAFLTSPADLVIILGAVTSTKTATAAGLVSFKGNYLLSSIFPLLAYRSRSPQFYQMTLTSILSITVPIVTGVTPVFQIVRNGQVVKSVTSTTFIRSTVVTQDILTIPPLFFC